MATPNPFSPTIPFTTKNQLKRLVHARGKVSDTEARTIYTGTDSERHHALYEDAHALSREEQIVILRPDYHPGHNRLCPANTRVWFIPFEN